MNRDIFGWINLIKEHLDVTDDEADRILWEETDYPLGATAEVERQIREHARCQNEKV